MDSLDHSHQGGGRRGGAFAGVLAVAILAAAVLAAASLVDARNPDRNGQIHACVDRQGKGQGKVRLVDRERGRRCKRGERRISWSATGPSGAAGERGPQGERGLQGAPGGGGR